MQQQLASRVQNVVSVALDLVPFAMLIADGSARVIGANRRWTEMTGLDQQRSLESGWLHGLTADSRLRLQAEVHRVLAEGGTSSSDHQIIGATKPRWSRWWLSRHVVDSTPLIAMAAADVDDDYARQASLYHLATHDSLTGLANRSHFMQAIDQALRRNERQSRRVGVVYVDLDGFKKVNDEGGHSLGDRVLFAIGARLRHAVRSADTVARIGGDEFAVLCEGLNAAEQAEIVARRIEHALSESVELDGERWLVPASVGAAVDRGAPDTAENLVDRADRAMYSIKQSRRSVTLLDEPTVDPTTTTTSERAPATAAARPGVAASGAGVVSGAVAASGAGVAPPVSPPPAPPASAGAPAAGSTGRPAEGGGAAPASSPASPPASTGRPAGDTAAAAAPATGGAVSPPASPGAPTAVPGGPAPASPRAGSEPAGARGPAPASAGVNRPVAGASGISVPAPAGPAGGQPSGGAGGQPSGGAGESAVDPPADAGPLGAADRGRVESDVEGLRESLASIRSMLDRLLTPEPPTIDIRDPEVRGRQP